MKIAIDVSQIQFLGTGVATYTRNLVEALIAADKENEYALFFSSLRKKVSNYLRISLSGEIKTRGIRLPLGILEAWWNLVHKINFEKFCPGIDIYHSSDWIQAPAKCRKVTTIHDLSFFRNPNWLDPKIVAVQKRRLSWVKKECDKIIAVSMATKNDIVELLQIAPSKIEVIYEAADTEFGEFKVQSSKIKTISQNLKLKYDLADKYLLVVGTGGLRKNLKRILTTFARLKQDEYQLVIIGVPGVRYQVPGVRYLGFVPQADLPSIFASARALIYVPFYEGFGLPVVEAMTVGCPVITGNLSSLPEVGGEAAIYADPYDDEDIKDKINKIISMNDQDYLQLREKSLQQAEKFSWEKAARETLKVYESLYG